MSEPDMKQAMQSVQRFAELWAAEITATFKPFAVSVARMQQNFRDHPPFKRPEVE